MTTLKDRIADAVNEYHRESSEHAYDPDVLVESICFEIQEFITKQTN